MKINPFNQSNSNSSENLVDEKENKALKFIFILAILGLLGIGMFSYQEYITAKRTNSISLVFYICSNLYILSGAIFVLGCTFGFLFGIPRSLSNENNKNNLRYIGNDNLLQISDWLTKIIVGLGLTQLNDIPIKLLEISRFISDNMKIANTYFILFVILYFSCIGFLFGYLWTRLYFIKMLSASDNDVEDSNQNEVELKTE